MKIIRAKDYDDMSRKVASLLAAQLMLKPASVLGLATGSTPLGCYAQLAEGVRRGDVSFAEASSINLDEYVGLGPQHPQGYRAFMQENLFRHVDIRPENTHVPDGLAADAAAECARYDGVIAASGGIDMQLLGLGHNGHIGFNEPGEAFSTGTHRVALAQSTIEANTRFFANEAEVPREAYTMGIGSIMGARRVLVAVAGRGKAAILHAAFTGPVTPQVPASVLQLHPNVTIVADEEALARF